MATRGSSLCLSRQPGLSVTQEQGKTPAQASLAGLGPGSPVKLLGPGAGPCRLAVGQVPLQWVSFWVWVGGGGGALSFLTALS